MTIPSEIPVVLLCGGRGIWIDGSGERRAKGLVHVQDQPLLFHLLRHFCRHGARRFVLCCGYQIDEFRAALSDIGKGRGDRFEIDHEGIIGSIEIVDTGIATPTGERVRRVRSQVDDAPWFWVTYSDTLCPVDLGEMVAAHEDHEKIASCIAVRLPTRFRILGMRRGEVLLRGFADRPVIQSDFINGGFYIFQKEIFTPRYLGNPSSGILEEEVLEALARDGQLVAYPYEGPWQYLDSERDLSPLQRLISMCAENP